MDAHNEVPTMAALADLVARCKQIDRYDTQLAAAEETRISALASALVLMRRVLDLETIPPERLPARHLRAEHWALVGPSTTDAVTPAVKGVLKATRGLLVLDDHGQVKILSDRTWRGMWRTVTLWRDGASDLSAAALLEFLARLAALAQERAPEAAQALLRRRESLAAAQTLGPSGPRMSGPEARAD